jgi:hypothetical protein
MRRSTGALAFTDLLFNALLGFVVMFALAYLLINPVADAGKVDHKAEILITLTWPDSSPHDLDLYVLDPAGEMVWFRRKEAGLMHLDRDDLGRASDVFVVDGKEVVSPRNQEIVAIRGLLAGEYVVNVHLYRASGPLPVPATVRIERLNPAVRLVFEETRMLARQGEEVTFARFRLAHDGEVGGLSRLPRRLVPVARGNAS